MAAKSIFATPALGICPPVRRSFIILAKNSNCLIKLVSMHEKYMKKFLAGDLLAASRLMSMVEKEGRGAESVLDAIFPHVGKAYRIGVTGLTGAGKSSLINKLTRIYRNKGVKVGIVAVDPTSPFSGGALLGDRIRMSDSIGDDGVFIRSIASRGSETGLNACAQELADVLDAFGSEIIFLETVGIGQQEYRISFSVHTTVIVLVPEAGDDIQSLKSGLMEIGDVFVVNKADRALAGRFADDLKSMLQLRHCKDGWCPPVISTIANTGDGAAELYEAIVRHRKFLSKNGLMEKKRRKSVENRIMMITEEKLKETFWTDHYIKEKSETLVQEVLAGRRSPYGASRELLASFPGKKGKDGDGS